MSVVRSDVDLALLSASLLACDQSLAPQLIDPTYDDVCRYTDCSASGMCVKSASGAPQCLCNVGYANASCSRCETGFHRDALNRCVSDRRCADQDSDPCAPGGECVDDEGVIACACEQGYVGPRCNLCAERYARDPSFGCLPLTFMPPANDAGLPPAIDAGRNDASTAPTDAGCQHDDTLTMDFASPVGWPEETDTCIARAELFTTHAILRSQQGQTVVRLCAPSAINGFTTRHVELNASPTRAAEIELLDPATSIAFDYATRLQALSLTVLVNDVAVDTIDLPAQSTGAMTLPLDPPAQRIGFRSRNSYAQVISLDNIVSSYGPCQ